MYPQERVIVHCDLVAGDIGIQIGWMHFRARRRRQAAFPEAPGGAADSQLTASVGGGRWACEGPPSPVPGALGPSPAPTGEQRSAA